VPDEVFFDLLVAHDVRSSCPTRRIDRIVCRIVQHVRTQRSRTILTLCVILRLRKNTILKLRNHPSCSNSHQQQPSNTWNRHIAILTQQHKYTLGSYENTTEGQLKANICSRRSQKAAKTKTKVTQPAVSRSYINLLHVISQVPNTYNFQPHPSPIRPHKPFVRTY
jgi:hypothetical protein